MPLKVILTVLLGTFLFYGIMVYLAGKASQAEPLYAEEIESKESDRFSISNDGGKLEVYSVTNGNKSGLQIDLIYSGNGYLAKTPLATLLLESNGSVKEQITTNGTRPMEIVINPTDSNLNAV